MSFMTDRIFADTNLFVYAQSNDEYKSSRATRYIENSPVISTQVVNETVSVLIKKRPLQEVCKKGIKMR